MGTKIKKVGICLLIKDRYDYLVECLKTLSQTNTDGYDVTLLLHDDSSQDKRVKQLIEATNFPQFRMVKVYNRSSNGTWGKAFNSAVKHLLDEGKYDVVGSCDSDAVFHPEWLQQMLNVCLWAKQHYHSNFLGPFSAFNSSDIDFHQPIDCQASPYGDFVVKKRMGGLCYFFLYKDLLKIGNFEENQRDETMMTQKLQNLGIYNFCTKISYVDHIGHISLLNQSRRVPVARAVHGLFSVVDRPNTLNTQNDSGFDVVITLHEKDISVISYSIEQVVKFINPKRIFVITDPGNGFYSIYKNVFVIDENSFFDDLDICKIKSLWAKQATGNYDIYRCAGWIYQQLLKMAVVTRIRDLSDHYLVIDSDTFFQRHVNFFSADGKVLICPSNEYHHQYFKVLRRLLLFDPQREYSFIAHHLMISKRIMMNLLNDLSKNGRAWYWKILDEIDYSEKNSFSEFELYGHYMKKYYPNTFIVRRLRWINIPGDPNSFLARMLRQHFDFVSHHDYDRKKPFYILIKHFLDKYLNVIFFKRLMK